MVTETEKRFEERKLIKQETRTTIIISVALLISVGIYTLLAYFIKIEPPFLDKEPLEKIYGIINLIVIMIMVIILGVRRSIYYSPRFIKEDFTLTQVLQKWRIIDIILLAVTETIPLCGLVITFLGMPFNRTFHFFLASALLMLILMPVGLKIRGKLSILRKTHPEV
jgi:membrane-associated HD superfamily phosphohydrolase